MEKKQAKKIAEELSGGGVEYGDVIGERKDTPKTFREFMIEQSNKEYVVSVQELIKEPYINVGTNGFSVDVLKLIDTLKKKQRNDVVKYIVAKYGYEN